MAPLPDRLVCVQQSVRGAELPGCQELLCRPRTCVLLNVSDGKIKQNLQGNHACQNKRKLLLFPLFIFCWLMVFIGVPLIEVVLCSLFELFELFLVINVVSISWHGCCHISLG